MAEEPQVAGLGEKTKAQTAGLSSVFLFADVGALSSPLPVSYATYRTIRRDPTIALARTLVAAPVLAGSWTVETKDGVPDEQKDLITNCLLAMRDHIMETALLFGHVDFGWQSYEKIFEYKDDRIVLKKLKPLLPDITQIMVMGDTGAFAGLRQARDNVNLPLARSLLISFRVEGTNWYGEGLLENVRLTHNRWNDADAGASRYDLKVAGSRIDIGYPPGTSLLSGVETPNEQVAQAMGKSLEASGVVIHPTTGGDEDEAWTLEVLEDKGGRQPTFIDRLKYLDTLKVRALLIPERSVLEGQYGTKAEAAEHINLAITNMELVDRAITRHVNWHMADQLLALNFGESERGNVWLNAVPLVDAALEFLRGLYTKMLENPTGFMEEYGLIDTLQLKEALNVPAKEPEEEEGDVTPLRHVGGEPPPPALEESQRLGYLTRKLSGDGDVRRSG